MQARARAVERREVRETIYGVLFSLATAGSVVGEKAKLLEWLATTWSITDSDPETDPT